MKEIKAYIRPNKLKQVIEAVEYAGVGGMTIIDVAALSKWADPEHSQYSIDYIEKYCKVVKIELVCPSKMVDILIESIRKVAYSGSPGDGKIFVADIERAVAIRTGIEGYEAI